MTHRASISLSARATRLFTLGAVLCVLGAGTVRADPHRARLSRDLEDRLASGQEAASRVIVTGTPEVVGALATRYGARLVKGVHGGAVLEVTTGQLAALSRDADVDHASGDVPVRRAMAVTTEATGAAQVWGEGSAAGYTGRGVGVAVIDSGVARHRDLRSRIVASVDFTGEGRHDGYGHGTHVAGIIAGDGDAGYAGMAPGAHLVSLRVLREDGSGETSDVINAIDWAIAHRAQYRLGVINLSLGHPVLESYLDDPLCQAVQRAVDAGIVVVAAAGNVGRTPDGRPVVGGIISPGNAPGALTVGALNTFGTPQRSDDRMAGYSSRGPTAVDGLLKPDLAAPGTRVISTAAPGSYLASAYPERVVSGQGATAYMELSGTSMSAAVVSGSVALLLEARPGLTAAEVKLALQLSSSRVAGAGLIEAGAGSLNVVAALRLIQGAGMAPTEIAGEAIVPTRLAFGPVLPTQFSQLICSDAGVTGSILVWGNEAPLCGPVDPSILVWGDSLVWGNILVWGNSNVSPDILVWGNSRDNADITSNILVWGNIDFEELRF